jgi:hypothetical protein
MGLRDRASARHGTNAATICVVARIAAVLRQHGAVSGDGEPLTEAEWLDAVENPDASGKQVGARALSLTMKADFGLEIGQTSIERHRRRECQCRPPEGTDDPA